VIYSLSSASLAKMADHQVLTGMVQKVSIKNFFLSD